MISQNTQIQKLLKSRENPDKVLEAFEFAKVAYKDKQRLTGENYIEHALRVALFLAKMGADDNVVILALLHDSIDEKPDAIKSAELKEMENIFGREVAGLVKKNSDLSKIRFSLEIKIKQKKNFTREKIENLRKTFVALAGDLRVILVELASRLDGLVYLKFLPQDQQKIYAMETLNVFVPIANRLGLGEIKRQLEDQSFFYLFPHRYKWVQEESKIKYEEREKYIRKVIPRIKKILKKERVKFLEISYRAKTHWSVYKKLLKKDMDMEKIHDLIALRIITKDVVDCYKILGIIHKYFKPISEEIDDYIAKPKSNGYRSLHTSVFLPDGRLCEIQIRTEQMHREAEYGVCAHWSYKEKIDLKKESDKFDWVAQIPRFWDSFKIDFFTDQIFVFTPKGDIISLPKGSTPIDFAYAVHSDVGDHCESAKIAGKIVQLSHELENADVVEIIVNKNKKPSQDWLKFVKTNMARSHIKKAVAVKEPGFKLPIPHFIRRKFFELAQTVQKRREAKEQLKKQKPRQIYIAGQKGMFTSIAKCCNPGPGDHIKAYISKHRAIVLHKASCQNFLKLAENFPEKVIDAKWD